MTSWERAHFIIADDLKSLDNNLVQTLTEEGVLVFSSHFIIDCIVNERIINGGPYIIRPVPPPTTLAQEDEDDSVVRDSPVRQKKKRSGKEQTKRPQDDNSDDDDDDEQLIAEYKRHQQQQKKTSPRRAKTTKVSSSPASGRKVAAKKSATKKKIPHLREYGNGAVLDEFVGEFEDFVPGVGAFSVRVREHRN